MRFYQPHTEFYCGVDLHSRNMYPTVLNRQSEVMCHRNIKNDPGRFLKMLKDYRSSLVVSCESTSNWYWLADLCQDEGIEFVLGHALYMRAIHGTKTKNDRIDSEKIAKLTAAGLLPQAYVYSREHRSLRDLLRRRLRLVRQRAELQTHIRTINAQFNMPPLGKKVLSKAGRLTLPNQFQDEAARRNVEVDMELMDYYTPLIRSVERYIENVADETYRKERTILESITGVGKIISLTILLEIDRIQRFSSRQKFCSYARLVYPRSESDGKQYGSQGRKHGNPYLKWAFTEAAVLSAQWCEPIKEYLSRLERKYGAGKGKTILAHKLGRSVYYMLLRGKVFDLDKFLRS